MTDPREIAQRIADAVVVEMNRVWELGIVHRPENKGKEGCANFTPIIQSILETGTPWVSVSDKFPPNFERVVCFDQTAVRDSLVPEIENRYEVSSYSGHFWNCGHLCKVTHWQPLPSPPREEAK